jgi:hypothetical protein
MYESPVGNYTALEKSQNAQKSHHVSAAGRPSSTMPASNAGPLRTPRRNSAGSGRNSAPRGVEPYPAGRAPSGLGLPLERLDHPVEVRMSWAPVPLWFVPDEAAAAALVVGGVPRGRVWTTRELLDLFGIPALTTDHARVLARAKLAIDGVLTVTGKRPAVVWHDPAGWLPGLEP